MIRLRTAAGEVQEQHTGFVELCDSEGQVAFVLYRDGQVFRLFGKRDKEAERYAKLYAVEFVDHQDLKF